MFDLSELIAAKETGRRKRSGNILHGAKKNYFNRDLGNLGYGWA